MPEKIVVALASLHRAPLAWAVERAARTGADVELLCVIPRIWGERDLDSDERVVATAQDMLASGKQYAEQSLARLDPPDHDRSARPGGSAVTAVATLISTRWVHGHVTEELKWASADADLMVMGTHDTRSQAGATTASLGPRLAQEGACSVVLVPHDWMPGSHGVVVGVDGGLPAELALQFAAEEAVSAAETLTVVCAGAGANRLLAGLVPDATLDAHRERVVDDAVESARGEYPDLVVDGRVIDDAPAPALLGESATARLLVIGSRGRHGAKRMLFGSVGHDVLLNLRCPVVVVRPARRDGSLSGYEEPNPQ